MAGSDATDHRVLFDDTYTGVRYRYGCRHGRGWTWFGIPEGSIAGSGRKSDEYVGGVWDYPSPIPGERAERFSMEPLGVMIPEADLAAARVELGG
jgi:hypothetical protein